MDLVPFMFYERQEAGSQLCAQHCLNNLLQQHTYTEFDLADVARRLDQAENAALASENKNKKSYNYDDTGYFSISVLERAMEVWDLTLVRWRGEAMKPYQDRPEDQGAFILHLANHWIPLRRFGIPTSTGSPTKRWYNLNSFLPNGPEWISPTYLRMVLSQAEEEGYSVFCVRRATPGAEEGQEVAEGKGWGDGGYGILPESEADRMAALLGEPVSRTGGAGSAPTVARSSRAPLASINPDQPTVDPSSISNIAGPSSPPARRRKRQEDLLDPEPHHTLSGQPARPPRNPARNPSADILDNQTGTFATDDQDDEELDDETDAIGSYRRVEDYAAPMDFAQHSRSYDDEDAALQAALKASMDDLPADWVPPKLEPKEKPIEKRPLPSPAAPAPAISTAGVPAVSGPASGSKFKEEIEDDDDAPVEELSPDEIRRRRLAKFGQ